MEQKRYVTAIDLGSYKIRTVVAEMTSSGFHIVGVGQAPSHGLKKGAIVDLDDVSSQLKRSVEEASRMTGWPIDQAFIGLAGSHLELIETRGVVAISREDREIRHDDVERVIEAAKVIHLPEDRIIVDVIPRSFTVDGLSGITDPRGMVGVRLEMEGRLVTASKAVLHNLLRVLDRSEINPLGMVMQVYAGGELLLTKDERKVGTVYIDMGSETTTVTLFQHDDLKRHIVLPFGGGYVTHDIANGLGITVEHAEKLKLLYGVARLQDASNDLVFEYTPIGRDKSESISQRDLAFIIEPRMDEMLQLVRKTLETERLIDLPGGVVWTGGGSAIPGFVALAKDIVEPTSRVLYPDYIGVRDPSFSAVIGIIRYALPYLPLTPDYPAEGRKKNVRVRAKDKTSDDSFLGKVKRWFHEFI